MNVISLSLFFLFSVKNIPRFNQNKIAEHWYFADCRLQCVNKKISVKK